MSTIRSRRTLSLVAAGAVTVMLAACSTDDSSSTATDEPSETETSSSTGTSPSPETTEGSGSDLPKTIVFSPLSLQPPALKGLSEGLKGYAGSKGWEVVVQDPNFDPAKQIQALQEVISSGRAGAVWTIAVAPETMGPVIEAAQSKGIPILVNGTPDEYGFDGAQPGIVFDYIDYEVGGSELGKQTGACINDKLDGKSDVLWLQSAAGSAGKEEFDSASKDALEAAAPDAEIVQELIAVDRAKAQTDVGAALQGNPDVTTVMAANDEAALGAIGAFAAAGKEVPCVIDFGGSDELLKSVTSGDVFASVALQFEGDLAQSFDSLAGMQADASAEGPILTVPQKTITSAG